MLVNSKLNSSSQVYQQSSGFKLYYSLTSICSILFRSEKDKACAFVASASTARLYIGSLHHLVIASSSLHCIVLHHCIITIIIIASSLLIEMIRFLDHWDLVNLGLPKMRDIQLCIHLTDYIVILIFAKNMMYRKGKSFILDLTSLETGFLYDPKIFVFGRLFLNFITDKGAIAGKLFLFFRYSFLNSI